MAEVARIHGDNINADKYMVRLYHFLATHVNNY
jgi:hypothetical protein